MKELSIEAKAKRYDELLLKLQKAKVDDNVCDEMYYRVIDDIVPELKESEDERIMKALYKMAKVPRKEIYEAEGITKEQALAWLEKQGDKDELIKELGEYKAKYTQEVLEKHLRTMNKDDERLRKTTIAFLKDFAKQGYENAVECIDWLEKKGEQKPNYCHHEVDLSGCSEEYRKAYYDGWNNCNMQHSQCKSELDDVVKCLINGMKFYYEDNEEATWGTDKWSMPVKHIIEVLEKQGEQKPQGKSALEAINEENVDNANKVESRQEELTEFEKAVKQVMEEAIECGDTHNLKADAEMLLSLVHNSSWSEEDDIMKQNCHQMLALLRPNSSELIKDIIDNCHHWLKSLKGRVQSQFTWKPSDEQMDALHYVTNFDYGGHKATLVSLYKDLKKLKG